MLEQTTDKLIDLSAVKGLTGIGRSTIYNLMKGSNFPQPVRLSSGANNRCSRWSFNEIQDWIEQKKVSRAS